MIQRPNDSCAVAYGVFAGDGRYKIPKLAAATRRLDGRYRLVGIEKMKHDPNQIAAVLAGGDDLWVAFNMNTEAWKS